ncbi:Similar to tld: Dorsal-ventral patterning protein tolloid (Drosophila melanogaster) [Cotesia congregata]|uniref:Metalloendopeptidase n=1 Tax=Cotesia congregata TaxID=51543 RepID=A0A8J2H659_COTCN|nr:Similar to tld: Dorsal-ventral patterning protein tolloid (Drosophila melanogaster) [Cotesia congregata]
MCTSQNQMLRCYTNGVGRSHAGRNHVYLGENCLTKRIMLPELGHIIGLHHEHKRSDRDKYVRVNIDNINNQKGVMNDFEKLSSEDAVTFNQTYDYNSIMHYRTNAFARDRSKQTITPLKAEDIQIEKIGRQERLSEIDIRGVKMLYNCSVCGQLLENDTGTLETTIYVNTSTTTAKHCEWSIVASRGERIVLEITTLSILDSKDCTIDYLNIRDEYKTGYNSLGRFCRKKSTTQTVGSSDSRILVTYHANNANEEYFDFKAKYHTYFEGDIEINNKDQEYFLESPGFPNEYPPNKYRVWYLVAPFNSRLILKFTYFDLETSDNCNNDYVEIRNGDAYYSPLIGKYCNNTSPEVIWSKGYALYVNFVSNSKVQGGGFSAIITLR